VYDVTCACAVQHYVTRTRADTKETLPLYLWGFLLVLLSLITEKDCLIFPNNITSKHDLVTMTSWNSGFHKQYCHSHAGTLDFNSPLPLWSVSSWGFRSTGDMTSRCALAYANHQVIWGGTWSKHEFLHLAGEDCILSYVWVVHYESASFADLQCVVWLYHWKHFACYYSFHFTCISSLASALSS
jgi:hypothetical protein